MLIITFQHVFVLQCMNPYWKNNKCYCNAFVSVKELFQLVVSKVF